MLINDERTPQPYRAEWTVRAGDLQLAKEDRRGQIGPAQNLLLPLSFTVPAVATRTDGCIVMTATIGSRQHRDEFAFRVFPAAAVGSDHPPLLTFDPEGATTTLLKGLGLVLTPWDGSPAPGRLVIIGRHALDRKWPLPGSPEAHVAAGGRLLILGQSPDWFRQAMGLRVAYHVSRRFFPVPSQARHPVLAGLDAEDFRDWRGAGTLVAESAGGLDEYPDATPRYGWHWGNQGNVSSAAIEKPHTNGWRPILEGEFDLAHSPLMELNYGCGSGPGHHRRAGRRRRWRDAGPGGRRRGRGGTAATHSGHAAKPGEDLLPLQPMAPDADPDAIAGKPWRQLRGGCQEPQSRLEPRLLASAPGRDVGEKDGAFWVRREVQLPAEWVGRELILQPGSIDDRDVTWFNGVKVGESSGWNVRHSYRIPGNLVRAGRNVITIRVFDEFGGGFDGRADDMRLGRAMPAALAEGEEILRNPDFRDGTTGWNLSVIAPAQAKAAVTAETPPELLGQHAVKVEVSKPSDTSWHVQLSQSGFGIQAGVSYVWTAWARASAPCSIIASIEKNHPPYGGAGLFARADLTPEWQRIRLDFTPRESDDNVRFGFQELAKQAVTYGFAAPSFMVAPDRSLPRPVAASRA